MSKDIHLNVSGVPTDTPIISDDVPHLWLGHFNPERTRCSFALPDSASGGGHLRWNGQNVNFLIPAASGNYEGGLIGLPTITYQPAYGLHIQGGQFLTNSGDVWVMKGATEFNLPAKMRAGEDIRGILRQRKAAGANCVRSLAMGYPFRPDPQPLTMAQAVQYWDICAEEGLYVLWCVFAGTATVMPNEGQQQAYWSNTQATAASHPNVLLQLANEWNHGTQHINPGAFSRPYGSLGDHGPGLTDEPSVRPLWDFATYHARRDPNCKGFTNYDCMEFEADPWPKPCPMIPGEGAKPEGYGNNPAYAFEMGQRAGNNWGGVFHSQEGVESRPWPAHVEVCARAFYEGIDG